MSFLKSTAGRIAGASLAAGALALSGVGIAHAAEEGASNSDVVVVESPAVDETVVDAPSDTVDGSETPDVTDGDPTPSPEVPGDGTVEENPEPAPAPAPEPAPELPVDDEPVPAPAPEVPVEEDPAPEPIEEAPAPAPAPEPAPELPVDDEPVPAPAPAPAPAPVPAPAPANAPGNSGEHRAALPQQALENNQSHKNDAKQAEKKAAQAEKHSGRG